MPNILFNSEINEGYNECKSKIIRPHIFSQMSTHEISLQKDAKWALPPGQFALLRTEITCVTISFLQLYFCLRRLVK